MDKPKFSPELFSQRLKSLIEESGKSQRQIAKELEISAGTLSKYIKGACEPGLNLLLYLASYFNVSLDYLLGVSPCKSYHGDTQSVGQFLELSDQAVRNLKHGGFAEKIGTEDHLLTDEEKEAVLRKYRSFQSAFFEDENYTVLLSLLKHYVTSHVRAEYIQGKKQWAPQNGHMDFSLTSLNSPDSADKFAKHISDSLLWHKIKHDIEFTEFQLGKCIEELANSMVRHLTETELPAIIEAYRTYANDSSKLDIHEPQRVFSDIEFIE